MVTFCQFYCDLLRKCVFVCALITKNEHKLEKKENLAQLLKLARNQSKKRIRTEKEMNLDEEDVFRIANSETVLSFNFINSL